MSGSSVAAAETSEPQAAVVLQVCLLNKVEVLKVYFFNFKLLIFSICVFPLEQTPKYLMLGISVSQ